jgi:hypothetical protein
MLITWLSNVLTKRLQKPTSEQLEDALEANTDLQAQLDQEHKESSRLNVALNVA